ncbi:MAG: Crp/Fnr family transcriptional regulator [Bacteroidetes bacterium]|nr:Crp/Fnr family transcriptional regulator [Bacteroidota bacterium]MBL7103517.1 Crp/Fnr family transcriptional regulator [Bacteroidales bacterium]
MDNFSESVNCLKCKRSSKCFKKLIPSELEFINQNKTQILYRKGENICKHGAFASYVLYISDGLVRLYLENPNNKNINLKILKTSEFIGLSSIYGDNIYNYSTVALKDSVICLIEKDSFRKLLADNGHFASEIIKWYCENEKQLFNKIQNLGNKQMHGRLADALLYLCNQDLLNEQIFSHLSRKDIAGFAGLSTESTVRLLTELKNENIIDITGKEIKILNPVLLKDISKRG